MHERVRRWFVVRRCCRVLPLCPILFEEAEINGTVPCKDVKFRKLIAKPPYELGRHGVYIGIFRKHAMCDAKCSSIGAHRTVDVEWANNYCVCKVSCVVCKNTVECPERRKRCINSHKWCPSYLPSIMPRRNWCPPLLPLDPSSSLKGKSTTCPLPFLMVRM